MSDQTTIPLYFFELINKSNKLYPVCIFSFVYFILGFIGIYNHEVWLDEAHHFLIAKDSISFLELVNNIRYEGHPMLWSFLVFIITRFTDSIFYMQLMNCLIMTMVCFLFLKHSRLGFILNILILSGYFFLYEYQVISRSYSLLLLALTLLFISLQHPAKNKLFYFSILLLSFTHVFGIIISLSVCFIMLIKKERQKEKPALFLIIAAGLLILWFTRVPADHFLFKYDSGALVSYKKISKTAGMLAKGFLPLPDITENIKWNSNLFTNKLRLAGVLAGLFVFLLPLYFFRKNQNLQLIYIIPCLLICAFMHLSPVAVSVRYCGIMFILFIYIVAFLFPDPLNNKAIVRFLTGLCAVHLVAGLIMYSTDLQSEFSNAKKVSEFIKTKTPDNKIVMAANFSSAPAISCYLNKKIYYPEHHAYGSYCKWNSWPFILNNDELTEEIKRICPPNDTLILVLNEHYLKADLHDTLNFRNSALHYKLVKKFEGAMVNNENYSLFYIYSD